MHRTDDTREQRVQDKIEQLAACRGDWRQLHTELDRKRQAWWEANKGRLRLHGSPPRQAYTLFVIVYLRLDPSEAPVVYEDEHKIVWRSFNFCPVLEACTRSGLDTRQVCCEGTEQSVQNLISHVDPGLRFGRNYADGIRPYAPYCEETIEVAPQETQAVTPSP